MGVLLHFYPRHEGQLVPSRDELVRCIETTLGLNAEASDVAGRENEADIVVTQSDGSFAIELFLQNDGPWWCQRPNDEQMDLFAKIADAAGFDVEFDGEVSRWSNGEIVVVRAQPKEPFRIRGRHVFFAIMALFWVYYLATKFL